MRTYNWNHGARPDLLRLAEDSLQSLSYAFSQTLSRKGYGLVASENPVTSPDAWTAVLSGGDLIYGPGWAVFPNGKILYTEKVTYTLPPLPPETNVFYVVMRYMEDGSTDKDADLSGNWTSLWWEWGHKIYIVEESEWNNPQIWSPDTKEECLIIATLRTGKDVAGGSLVSISYEDRAWWAAADWEHRALKGTGSDDVPHSISLGDLGFYALLGNQGWIHADSTLPGVVGVVRHAVISATDILDDPSGSVTGEAGSRFFYLDRFPVRLLGLADNNGDPVAGRIIQGTKIIAIPVGEFVPSSGLHIWYSVTDLMEVSKKDSNTLIFSNTENKNEWIISGGKTHIPESDIEFSTNDLGPFPRDWQLYTDGDRIVSEWDSLSDPQLVRNLDSDAPLLLDGEVNQHKLIIGLSSTLATMGLNLILEIHGQDETWADVVETLRFWTPTTYMPPLNSGSSVVNHLSPDGLDPIDYSSGANPIFIRTYYTYSYISKVVPILKEGLHSHAVIRLWEDVHVERKSLSRVARIEQNVDNSTDIGKTVIYNPRDTRDIRRDILDSSVVQTAALSWKAQDQSRTIFAWEDYKDSRYLFYKESEGILRYPIDYDCILYTYALDVSKVTRPLNIYFVGDRPVKIEYRYTEAATPAAWESWTELVSPNTEFYDASTQWIKVQLRFTIQRDMPFYGWWIGGLI